MGIFFGLNVVRKQEAGVTENWVPDNLLTVRSNEAKLTS